MSFLKCESMYVFRVTNKRKVEYCVFMLKLANSTPSATLDWVLCFANWFDHMEHDHDWTVTGQDCLLADSANVSILADADSPKSCIKWFNLSERE